MEGQKCLPSFECQRVDSRWIVGKGLALQGDSSSVAATSGSESCLLCGIILAPGRPANRLARERYTLGTSSWKAELGH